MAAQCLYLVDLELQRLQRPWPGGPVHQMLDLEDAVVHCRPGI